MEPRYVADETNPALRTLLVEANLRRERQQWGRAQALCLRLLRKHPTSAAAHAVMGDVFADQERTEDAIEWYQLALDLEDLPEVKGKLNKLLEVRPEVGGMLIEAPLPAVEPVVEPQEYTWETSLAWLRKNLFAVLGAAGALLIIIVVVALAWKGAQTEAPEPETIARRGPMLVEADQRALQPVGSQQPAAQPAQPAQIVRPASRAPAVRVSVPPRPMSSRGTAPVRATFMDRSKSGSLTASSQDRELTQALSRLTWPDGTKVGPAVEVVVDPARSFALLSFRMPEKVPEAQLGPWILVQSFRFARELFDQVQQIEYLTVRALVELPAASADKGPETVVAFRGNTTRAAVRRAGTTEPSIDQLGSGSYFAEMWWDRRVAALVRRAAAARSGSR